MQATMKVTLGIAGPFLCSGTAPVSWGIDETFDRDYLGRPYIAKSHIKGKLREAFVELQLPRMEQLFGKGGDWENGLLFFTDFFVVDAEPVPAKLTRIKINQRGVVEPNAMLVMENAFPGSCHSGEEKCYPWQGEISFTIAEAAEEKERETVADICRDIRCALKWIAALGAEKGIGFGRLQSVTAPDCEPVPIDLSSTKDAENPSDRLTLVITAQEALLLGDVKMKVNYQESMTYITGNALKGAIVHAVNRACGVPPPTNIPIDETNKKVVSSFPLLARYFGKIRFTHAFPSHEQNKRPVVIPYSIVKAGEKHYDMALCKEPPAYIEQLPAFQIDWKSTDYPDGFGWAIPRRFVKTRTAIDGETRRADDGSMFTYQYVCPEDENGKAIHWVGGIYLDCVSLQPGDTLPRLQGELDRALGLLKYIGKRSGNVSVCWPPGEPAGWKGCGNQPTGTYTVVALQSDALMVDPSELCTQQSAARLDALYKAYWAEFCRGACELSHFFAAQKMRGGYLQRSKQGGGSYYPYYLTEAGSVFVLKINEGATAETLFQDWRMRGLPLPKWVRKTYGDEVWRRCPYVPENGFGEVLINPDLGIDRYAVKGGAPS